MGESKAAQAPELEALPADDLDPLPEPMIEDLKVLANKRDVPYQSLRKIYVAERIEEELRTNSGEAVG